MNSENKNPANQKENPAPDENNIDPLVDAHSVHSELYHSTVQPGFQPNSSPPRTNIQEQNPNPQIQSGFLPNKPPINDPNNKPSVIMQREQINEDSNSCTDKGCLILAVIVILGSMVGFIVVLTKGTVNELVSIDTDGNECGGEALSDYPYLFMENGATVGGICISYCPNTTNTSPNVENGENLTTYETVTYQDPRICLPTQDELFEVMEENLQFNQANLILNEFQESVSFFFIEIGSSVLLSLFLLFLFRFFKKTSIYILVLLTLFLMLATGVMMITSFADYDYGETDLDTLTLDNFSADLNFFSGYLILGIIMVILTAFWLVKLFILWRNGDLNKLSKLLKTCKDINKQNKFLPLIGIFSYVLTWLSVMILIIFFEYLIPLFSSPAFSFTEIPSTSSSTESTVIYKILAYASIPTTLWLCSTFLSFTQFSLAIVTVAKYLSSVNSAILDPTMRIFSNKLNYHIGSIFLAGMGNLLALFINFTEIFLKIISFLFMKCCPTFSNYIEKFIVCLNNFKEKFSGKGFIIIALSNTNLIEANELASKIIERNKAKYSLEANLGEILGTLCAIIIFCEDLLIAIGFLMGKINIQIYFLPTLTFAGMGYFCGLAMSAQVWYEIDVIYILFCIWEEVIGKREENQYTYENQMEHTLAHSKINDIGGIYSIIRISGENEKFTPGYGNFA